MQSGSANFLLRCIKLRLQVSTETLEDSVTGSLLLLLCVAAKPELHWVTIVGVARDVLFMPWTKHNGYVEGFPQVDREGLPSGGEGEATLAIVLEEETRSLWPIVLQGHVLPLVGLVAQGCFEVGELPGTVHVKHSVIEGDGGAAAASAQAREEASTIRSVQHVCLPVDVHTADFNVTSAAALSSAAGREVLLAGAVHRHTLDASWQLRRSLLQHEHACALLHILLIVLSRGAVPVDLKAGDDVATKAYREVEANEEGRG
mmetsp:Transcript_8112/g.18068  ORF Transcript_8112/g.18068 Transcript_8112/m.18068 type:complete len:260 (+) Transcript_8112:62-841(+)